MFFEDYIVQNHRFSVIAGLGCTYALDYSILMLILLAGWGIFIPLISVIAYYREYLSSVNRNDAI